MLLYPAVQAPRYLCFLCYFPSFCLVCQTVISLSFTSFLPQFDPSYLSLLLNNSFLCSSFLFSVSFLFLYVCLLPSILPFSHLTYSLSFYFIISSIISVDSSFHSYIFSAPSLTPFTWLLQFLHIKPFCCLLCFISVTRKEVNTQIETEGRSASPSAD